MTASVGISIYPDDGTDQQTLLKNADIAMYRAKEQGKNNYKFYSTQMNSHSFERLALETSLRRASSSAATATSSSAPMRGCEFTSAAQSSMPRSSARWGR